MADPDSRTAHGLLFRFTAFMPAPPGGIPRQWQGRGIIPVNQKLSSNSGNRERGTEAAGSAVVRIQWAVGRPETGNPRPETRSAAAEQGALDVEVVALLERG